MTEEFDLDHAPSEAELAAAEGKLAPQPRWLPVGLGLLALILVVALAWPVLGSRITSRSGAPQAPTAEPLAEPGNEAQSYQLAGDHYRAGRFDEAWAQFRGVPAYQALVEANSDVVEAEQAVQASPPSKEAHFKLGTLWARAQLLAPAEIAFQQALALDPAYADAHANLGVVYYQMGRLSDALGEFDAALKDQPDDADIHHNKGNVFVQQALLVTPPDENLLSQAIAEFEQALEISPDLAQAHFSLGAVYFIKDQKQQAIAEFEQFLNLDDGSDPAATSAAQNYLQQLQQ